MLELTPQTITALIAFAVVILAVVALQAVNRLRRSRRADTRPRGETNLTRQRVLFLAAVTLLTFLVVSLLLR